MDRMAQCPSSDCTAYIKAGTLCSHATHRRQSYWLDAAWFPYEERYDQTQGSFYVKFSKDTISKIAQKFAAKGFANNINLDHDQEQKVNGVIYQSFVTDSKMGIKDPKGFNNPEGTWYVAMKIKDPIEWAKIKEEGFKGFSVEGMFDQVLEGEKKENKIVKKIDKLLKGDH